MIRIPETVVRTLDASIRRVRRIYLLRGIAATLAMLLAAMLIVMAIDARVTIFSDVVRWMLSCLIYLSVVAVAGWTLVRPLLRPLDRLRLAKIIDERHPEHEECLTTLIELANEAPDKASYSAALALVLEKKSAAAAEALDPVHEFTPRTVVRRLLCLLVVVLLLALAFGLAPRRAGLLLVRAVAPWVDVGNFYSGDIAVEPGDVKVLVGTKIRIEATVSERLADAPEIRLSRRTAEGWSAETVARMPGGVYETIADADEREWRYRVCAGPAVTRYYTVKVCDPPTCSVFTVTVTPPAYAALEPSVLSKEEALSVTALEGSHVAFEIVPEGEGTGVSFTLDDEDGVRSWTAVSNRTVAWSLSLRSAEGFASPERRGRITSRPDQAPTIVLKEPQAASMTLPPHAKFPIAVTAGDDTGLMRPRLRMRCDGGEWTERRELASFEREAPGRWQGQDEIDLSMLALDGVRQVAFDVVVDDVFPADWGGPHAATTTPVVVRIEARANPFDVQTLQDQKKLADKDLDSARNRLRDAQRSVDRALYELERDKKITDAVEHLVDKSAHETEEAAKRLRDLEDRMRADGRFDPVADRLAETLDRQVEPARKALEQAQFADVERRREDLREAAKHLKDALSDLDRYEQAENRHVSKLEGLEKTKDLLARQEALARTAEKLLEERPLDTRRLDAWRQMEQEAANRASELRRQQNDPEIDEAVRKMEKAAEEMDDLKHALERAARKDRTDAQRQEEEERAARDHDARSLARLDDAVRTARHAEDLLRHAEQDRVNADRWTAQAVDRERQALDSLEKAEAAEKVKDLHRQALEETRASALKETPVDEARARLARARRAAEAEAHDARDAQEERMARSDQDRERIKSRREAERERARQAAEEAQRKAVAAMEKKSREGFRESREAAERAAEEMARASVPEALRDAQEAALAAAREIERQFAAAERQAEADRHAAETAERAEREARDATAAEAKAAEARHRARAEQEKARAEQASARQAQQAAEKAQQAAAHAAHASADRRNAEKAQEAAEKAQQMAEKAQEAAHAAHADAAKRQAEAEKAAHAAKKAREAAAEAREKAALMSGDRERIAAAHEKSVAEQAEAARAEAARTEAHEAEAAVHAAQRKSAEAQQAAREAQQAAREALKAASDAASAEHHPGEADRRAETAQRQAAEAQAEARAAQDAALEAWHRAHAARERAVPKSSAAEPPPSADRSPLGRMMEETAFTQRKAAEALTAESAARAGELARAEAAADRRDRADRLAEEAAAAANALDAAVDQAREARKANERAADLHAVEQHAARLAELHREATEDLAAGDFAAGAERLRQAAQVAEEAVRDLEDLAHSGVKDATSSEALRAALASEREALKAGRSSLQHAEHARQNPRNGHAVVGSRIDLDRAVAAQRAADEALEELRAAESKASPSPAGASKADGAAQAAAESLARSLARQRRQLGVKDPGPSGETDGESESSGALSAELSRVARALPRTDDPERLRSLLGTSSWFRIRGSAKDGLGEMELKGVSPEYRDLVRLYFLKLANER